MDAVVDRLISAGRELADAQRWLALRDVANGVLALAPANAEAQQMLRLAEARENRHRPHPGERRHMTLVFCDQVGSTAFAQHHPPEHVRDILRMFYDVAGLVMRKHGGEVHRHLGDGILAYFAYPRPHEDDPRRAVHAAMELLAAIRPLQDHVRDAMDDTFALRIGVHTGTVIVADLGTDHQDRADDIAGDAVNIAARLQDIAGAEQIVLSDVTAALVSNWFHLESLGEQQLKGVSRPVVAFRVAGVRDVLGRVDAAGSALSPLTGRREELARLDFVWEAARRGVGSALLIHGEPGIGKSRLAWSIVNRCALDGGRPFVAVCSPDATGIPWQPVRAGLRRYIGVREGDPARLQLDALEEHGGELSASRLGLLATVLAIDADGRFPQPELHPAQLRLEVAQALREWLVSLGRTQPVAALIEDIHWSDEATRDWVASLPDAAAECRLLVLTTSRAAEPALGNWMSLGLGPLSIDDSAELAAQLLRSDRQDPLVRALVDRGDGVPLFLEELVRSARSGRSVPAEEVPFTLRDLLASAILQPEVDADITQVFSTIGREADGELLIQVFRALYDVNLSPEQLTARFSPLLSKGFVTIDASSGGPDRYRFRHALMREAAYESQPLDQRAERHSAIADVLCAAARSSGPSEPAVIARHFSAAGRAEEAVAYRLTAAEQASASGAFDDALAQLHHAWQDVQRVDPERRAPLELGVRASRASTLVSLKGYAHPDVAEDFTICLDLCRAIGDIGPLAPQVAHVLLGLWAVEIVGGRVLGAGPIRKDVAELCQRRSLHDLLPVVASLEGMELLFQGRFTAAAQRLEEAASSYDPTCPVPSGWRLPNDPLVATFAAQALAAAVRCDTPTLDAAEERALAQARVHRFPLGPFSEAFARAYLALAHRLAGGAAAGTHAAVTIEIGQRHAFVDWVGVGAIHLAAFECLGPEPASALAQFTSAVGYWRSFGGGLLLPMYLTEQAAASVRLGDLAGAAAALEEARGDAERTGQLMCAAETTRIQGRWHDARGDGARAAAAFGDAIDVAVDQGATSFGLRAALDLAGHDHDAAEAAVLRLVADRPDDFPLDPMALAHRLGRSTIGATP